MQRVMLLKKKFNISDTAADKKTIWYTSEGLGALTLKYADGTQIV